jgi:hypothetical protein
VTQQNHPDRSSRRTRRRHASRHRRRRRLDARVEPTEAERLAKLSWIEWGGELIWVAGFTAGGAAFGLRACDLDPDDLRAMGPEDAAPAAREPDGWPVDDIDDPAWPKHER